MQNKKGFTIIELIVVVAIIAVLAAIVSVNVITYLKKGKDAAIKSNLETAQTAMADWISNGTAFIVCTAASDVKKAYDAATTAAGTATGSNCNLATSVNGPGCVCVKLLNSANNFCVDSTGNKGEFSNASVNCDTDCGTSDYTCDGA